LSHNLRMLLLAVGLICTGCHPQQTARTAHTSMANSCGVVRAAAEPEGEVEHRRSGIRLRIERREGVLLLEWDKHSVALEFFIGSRRMGRSYAYREDGYLYQAPVGYYANKQTWDMAPGYESDPYPSMDRPITAECLFCHATGAKLAPGTVNKVINWNELHGIDCRRCHGDATRHAADPRRATIINPARLPRELRDSVCEQCHLGGQARISLPGKALAQFQPGESLSDYLDVFVERNSEPGVRVAGHAEALGRSRCAQKSNLWCGSCHSPHGLAIDVRGRCAACHSSRMCARGEDCIRCHMPSSRAFDGGHTVYTDHSIRRRPARHFTAHRNHGDLTAYYSRPLDPAVASRNLGLAYASIGDLEKAWPLLRSAVQAGFKDAPLYAQTAEYLEAYGHERNAVELYRLALEIDPEQDLALARLSSLLFRTGDTAGARELAERALRRNPRQSELRALLTSGR